MDETESMEKNNKDRFEGLLAKGKEQGFVSEDDILASIRQFIKGEARLGKVKSRLRAGLRKFVECHIAPGV